MIFQLKHGESGKTPEHQTWRSMRKRVYNDYPNWGGRGITIDPLWDDYSNFLEDMGRRPTSLHSLERIDNNGNYCKDNCKWATKAEQAQNKRDTLINTDIADEIRLLFILGRYNMKQLSNKFSYSSSSIRKIIYNQIWKTSISESLIPKSLF